VSNAVTLWRQLDRMAPRVGVGRALSGHAARWSMILAVAVVITTFFGPSGSLASAVGHTLVNFLVLAVFGVMLALYRPKLYASVRVVALFALAFVTILGVAAAAGHSNSVILVRAELIPVAMAAVLFSVLFDARISMVAATVMAVLIGVQPPYAGTPALFLTLISGAAAAFSVRVIRRRDQAYRSILVTAAASALAELAVGLASGSGITGSVWRGVVWGGINSVVSVALALMLLPPLEEFTGVDTYLKLLEWSDLNRPLMQRLSVEAPGTFAHTMRLANLAEAACNAIGANGLLARVGAYYHDVGKLRKPEYFVENQRPGRNPHDKLKPSMSAAIIRNHVREGLELADQYGLPDAVRAFITEHHGTSQITYFLQKAKERDNTPIKVAEFAYPGPVPQTAETAIVMLADGVEASAHVLRDPTPKRIREVIDHIVRQRIEHGQLRQAPITLQQVEVVKEQFARMMIGMYHHRIDYPSSTGGVTSQFAADDTGETPVFVGGPPEPPPTPVGPADAPAAAADAPAKASGGGADVNRETGLDAPVGAGTPAG
jgi:cyclic-di-AMP phosphodiesterase PgpH